MSTRAASPPATSPRPIGRGLAKAALAAKVDGEWVDLDRPIDHDATRRDRHPRHRRRARGAAPLHRARDGPGRHRPLPGRRVRDRPGDRRRLLLRLRASRRAHFSEDDLERIEARMREIVDADEPFVREEVDRDDALAAVRRPALQARDHREGRSGGPRGGRRGHGDLASTATRAPTAPSSSTSAAARTCRPPSGSARSSSRRSRARTGAATRSARCSSASTAPRGSRRPRSRSTSTASRRRRSATTASSAPSSTCSRSPRRSAPASRSSTRRAALVRKVMEDYSRARHEAAGYSFVNTPHITKADLFETSGPPRLVRRRHVPADAARRAATRVLPQADELPVPHPDLQEPDAVVPRAARCASSSSAPCTATSGRAWCTGSRACAA